MDLPEAIRHALQRNAAELAGEIISNPAIPSGIFVPLRIGRDAEGKQAPSHRTLANLRNDLAAVGYSAEFLLIDRDAKSVEDGLRASLISSFPDLVRNSFVTTTDRVAHVWIDNKREAQPIEIESLKSLTQRYVDTVLLRGFTLYFMSDEALPGNTEIMSFIKRLSPVGCEELCQHLQEHGFSVPSLDWINRRFDALRKAGLVIRRTDRSYAMSAEGLHRLGTRKNRNSPDVGRLLALARRGP